MREKKSGIAVNLKESLILKLRSVVNRLGLVSSRVTYVLRDYCLSLVLNF